VPTIDNRAENADGGHHADRRHQHTQPGQHSRTETGQTTRNDGDCQRKPSETDEADGDAGGRSEGNRKGCTGGHRIDEVSHGDRAEEQGCDEQDGSPEPQRVCNQLFMTIISA